MTVGVGGDPAPRKRPRGLTAFMKHLSSGLTVPSEPQSEPHVVQSAGRWGGAHGAGGLMVVALEVKVRRVHCVEGVLSAGM